MSIGNKIGNVGLRYKNISEFRFITVLDSTMYVPPIWFTAQCEGFDGTHWQACAIRERYRDDSQAKSDREKPAVSCHFGAYYIFAM